MPQANQEKKKGSPQGASKRLDRALNARKGVVPEAGVEPARA